MIYFPFDKHFYSHQHPFMITIVLKTELARHIRITHIPIRFQSIRIMTVLLEAITSLKY